MVEFPDSIILKIPYVIGPICFTKIKEVTISLKRVESGKATDPDVTAEL